MGVAGVGRGVGGSLFQPWRASLPEVVTEGAPRSLSCCVDDVGNGSEAFNSTSAA